MQIDVFFLNDQDIIIDYNIQVQRNGPGHQLPYAIPSKGKNL